MTQDTLRIPPKAARKLILDALTGAGAAAGNAGYFADAILDTELSGLEGHRFYWLQYYCERQRMASFCGFRWWVRQGLNL